MLQPAPARTGSTSSTGRHRRTPRSQLPPFILGMLSFLILWAAALAVTNLPAVAAPPVVAAVGAGLIVWAYAGATWSAR